MHSFKVLFESKLAANRIADVIDRNLVVKRSCIVEILCYFHFLAEWVNSYRDFQSFHIKIQSFQIIYYKQTFNCNNKMICRT